MQKIATSAYHPNGNGGVERVYHTMSQMLAMVVNEMQDDGDVHVPYVEFAYTNSASAATAWARIEVHMNRHPRLSLTTFGHCYARGHQSFARDHFEYCDLTGDRQRCAYEVVREQHALDISSVERRNSALSDALKQLPIYAVSGWVCIYNTAATIRQGTKSSTDAKVLKEKTTSPCPSSI